MCVYNYVYVILRVEDLNNGFIFEFVFFCSCIVLVYINILINKYMWGR